MPSVRKNFVWSTLLTMAGYVFPLITFPYVTRVLGVEGIGGIQFADSIVSYFTIFAMMGIGTVGVREIAKVKDNRPELSRIFCSLLSINLGLTIVSIAVLILLIHLIPSFESHKDLLYIGASRVLCGALVIEWFFKGIEDFRYITICSILIRSIYVISVLIFIKGPNDCFLYFLLTALTQVLNVAINLIYAHKNVSLTFRNLIIRPLVKPVLVLGVYSILTQMYGSFNVIFLGDRCGDLEVGYYSTSVKLFSIIMSVFTAFTGVMLPRMSSLLSEGKRKEFKDMTSKSIDFLLLFCMPIIVVAEVFAPQLVAIIAGQGYEGAILPMRIVMPLMLIIGYEQIIVIQMLMPLEKDNAILMNSLLGASVAILLNIIIVPRFASVGTAIVWIACELVVATSAQIFVTKYTGYKIPYKKIMNYIITYIPAMVGCYIISNYVQNSYIAFGFGIVFMMIFFAISELFILKNRLFVGIIGKIIH